MKPSGLRILAMAGMIVVLLLLSHWVAPVENARQPASTSVSAPESSVEGRLEQDERLGGHTLRRHVGRTDEQLRERLAREPNISAASTFTDLPAAEKTVSRTIEQNRTRIDQWLDADSHPNLALQFRGSEPIGRSLRRGGNAIEPCYGAVVVLRWDGGRDYHVLTAYPEVRRGR